MTPQKQTKLYSKEGGHNGNCFAACLASLLDIPIWMVPPFEEAFGRSEWYEDRANEWLKCMFNLKMVKQNGHDIASLPEFYVAVGKSPRGVYHATIYSKGALVHDPHFSDAGIESVENTWFLANVEVDQDDLVKTMVNRFLGWRLPESFCPDAGISFKPEYNAEYMAKQGKPPMRHEPIGTNLFDAKEAEQMVRYMLGTASNVKDQSNCALDVNRMEFESYLRECVPDSVTYSTKFKNGKYIAEFVQLHWEMWQVAFSKIPVVL